MLRKILFGSSLFFMQLWLGASIFFSIIVAPILFKTFGVEIAANVMGAVFPVYGYLGFFCATMGIVGMLLASKAKSRIGTKIYFSGLGLLVLTFLLTAAQAFYVFPRSHELRNIVKQGRAAGSLESIAPQAEEMMRLHGFSIGINNSLIVSLLFLAWVYYRVSRDWDKA